VQRTQAAGGFSSSLAVRPVQPNSKKIGPGVPLAESPSWSARRKRLTNHLSGTNFVQSPNPERSEGSTDILAP
jgi:hypothetical protein